MSGQPKILVVDDTPHNVKLLADILGMKGYVSRPRPTARRPWPRSPPINRT